MSFIGIGLKLCFLLIHMSGSGPFFIAQSQHFSSINRSQPPMFILMVKAYEEATGDKQFVKENLPYMLQEFEYWKSQHLVNVSYGDKTYNMIRYNCEDDGPRPESYVEDYELAFKTTKTEQEKTALYW